MTMVYKNQFPFFAHRFHKVRPASRFARKIECEKSTDALNQSKPRNAASAGQTECARIMIDAGADVHHLDHAGEAPIKQANNLEIVRLLVNNGADLNDISTEMRAALTHLPGDGRIRCTDDEYREAKHRRFGKTNPEKMNLPFWKAMIASGSHAYAARKQFNGTDSQDEAVWCFDRFGKSINELPDGRIIEIAGEHEDYYMPDFCIYNDVVVHRSDGAFDIYGYPEDVFPPTDFHTATLVGKYIYIVGSTGYPDDRKLGETQVYRLDTNSLQIEKLETSGEKPGWIGKHKAVLNGVAGIRISGGEIFGSDSGRQTFLKNTRVYILDVATMNWSC
jgi:hypothetical protein